MQDADLTLLERALEDNEEHARRVADGLHEAQGTWRADPGSWSVAQCLEHLAISNRVYLQAMQPAAARASREGRRRRRPALPGLVGRWFVRSLEPPARPLLRMKAPRAIRPGTSPSLGEALAQFVQSQHEVTTFLRTFAAIDLAGVRFPNPFIAGVRFSLATGLHVIAAHQRRHLWQASRVRQALEAATAAAPPS